MCFSLVSGPSPPTRGRQFTSVSMRAWPQAGQCQYHGVDSPAPVLLSWNTMSTSPTDWILPISKALCQPTASPADSCPYQCLSLALETNCEMVESGCVLVCTLPFIALYLSLRPNSFPPNIILTLSLC